MPTRDRRTDITMDPEIEAALRQVRESHGLDSDEAIMEFLLSRSIRVNGNRMTGRGRALYEVKRGPSD
jgi:hypothetical protein